MTKFRFAVPTDSHRLAELHFFSSKRQPDGFMFQLGRFFLKYYYRTILKDSSTIILCAINEREKIVGFVSGTMESEKRNSFIAKYTLVLLMASIPRLIVKPSMFLSMAHRFNSIVNKNSSYRYISQIGAREDYWAWDPNEASNYSIELHLRWLKIASNLGLDYIYGEVDLNNKDILNIHKILGAQIIEEYTTTDNRQRVLIRYKLIKSNTN